MLSGTSKTRSRSFSKGKKCKKVKKEMKAKVGIFAVMLLVLSSMAFAAPATGFSAQKWISVTGDWVWTGSSWTKPTPPPVTATYHLQADSAGATVGGYFDVETFGAPWYARYEGHTLANAAGTAYNDLHVVTVNPPDTTPGTAWTAYDYLQNNFGSYSSSSLHVKGFGKVDVNSLFNAQSPFQQDVNLAIN